VQMDDVVGALLGTCAYPSFSITVSQAGAEGRGVGVSAWSIHYLSEMAVEHRVTPENNHMFTGYAAVDQVIDRLCATLSIAEQPRPRGEVIELTQDVIDTARVMAAAGERRRAAVVLREAGATSPAARSLADALASLDELSQLVALRHTPADPRPLVLRTLTLVRAPSGFWGVVRPHFARDDLYAGPLSGYEARVAITALMTLGAP
jgi:hypothetical protein